MMDYERLKAGQRAERRMGESDTTNAGTWTCRPVRLWSRDCATVRRSVAAAGYDLVPPL